MTALIKLTLPSCSVYPQERTVYVNPANISQFYRGLKDDDNTYVELTSGITRMVKETPEEIAKLIWNAESIERKCRQCDGDGEANTFKPSVQKLEITMPSGCPDFYGLKEAPATSRGCSHCKECWEEAIENWLNKKYKEA